MVASIKHKTRRNDSRKTRADTKRTLTRQILLVSENIAHSAEVDGSAIKNKLYNKKQVNSAIQ